MRLLPSGFGIGSTEGHSALSGASSCCSKPQPPVPSVAMHAKSFAALRAWSFLPAVRRSGTSGSWPGNPRGVGLGACCSIPSSPKPGAAVDAIDAEQAHVAVHDAEMQVPGRREVVHAVGVAIAGGKHLDQCGNCSRSEACSSRIEFELSTMNSKSSLLVLGTGICPSSHGSSCAESPPACRCRRCRCSLCRRCRRCCRRCLYRPLPPRCYRRCLCRWYRRHRRRCRRFPLGRRCPIYRRGHCRCERRHARARAADTRSRRRLPCGVSFVASCCAWCVEHPSTRTAPNQANVPRVVIADLPLPRCRTPPAGMMTLFGELALLFTSY